MPCRLNGIQLRCSCCLHSGLLIHPFPCTQTITCPPKSCILAYAKLTTSSLNSDLLNSNAFCNVVQADPEKVKMQLLGEGLELEEYGGDVQCVETAAKAGMGLDALEEALLLQVIQIFQFYDGKVILSSKSSINPPELYHQC